MDARTTPSQRDTVLAVLRERGRVSAIELDREFGIYRAAARIAELRAMGFAIDTIAVPGRTALYVYRGLSGPLKPGVTPAPQDGPLCHKCGAPLLDVKPSPIDRRYVLGRCSTHGTQPWRVAA